MNLRDVDFAELEKRFLSQASETMRSQIIYASTVSGRFVKEPATVAYPPRHPATNIGE